MAEIFYNRNSHNEEHTAMEQDSERIKTSKSLVYIHTYF